MTYEEKFDIVVKAIVEARKITPPDYDTKLKITHENKLQDLDLDDIGSILYQIDKQKVIKVVSTANAKFISGLDPWTEEQDYFALEVLDTFDNWYENYLLQQKTNLENLNNINILRIYDVVLDINEQVQLTHKTTAHIPIIPSIIRFHALFPADTIGLRDEYCQNRLNSLKYLKEKGAISDYSHGRDGWDTIVSVSFILSKLDDFYKNIQDEYVKRNKPDDKKESTAETLTKIDRVVKDKTIWPDSFRWEGKSFIFGKYGSISLISSDRKHILKVLTDKKGGWATIRELKGNKNAGYVRSTIKQIEDRLPKEAKGHIKIVSTQEDDSIEKPNAGAYRIKVKQ